MKTAAALLALLFVSRVAAGTPAVIPLPGDGGWDYVAADAAARRLYVTHGDRVHIVDLDSGKPVGEIGPTPGVHGVAIAPEFGRGFISDGGDSTVTIFDTKTGKVLSTIKSGGSKPDAILYEPFSRRVFVFNGDSGDATAIDAATGKVVGRIDLGGAPEFAVSDGADAAYVNIEDKAETVKFDPVTLKVTARWSLAPHHTPTALAYDKASGRLLVGCRSKHLLVLDASSGAILAALPIGAGVDAIAFDAGRGRAFVGCGDGTLHECVRDAKGAYRIARVIRTAPGAKTAACDDITGKVYLPSAKREGRKIVSGSFHVDVIDTAE